MNKYERSGYTNLLYHKFVNTEVVGSFPAPAARDMCQSEFTRTASFHAEGRWFSP